MPKDSAKRAKSPAPGPESKAAAPVGVAARPTSKVEAPPDAVAAKPAAKPGPALPKSVEELTSVGLAQARDAYATVRRSAETATAGVNTSSQAATRGLADLSNSLLNAVHANLDAAMGFWKAMTNVRSISEAIELQAHHTRVQFEAAQTQAKTLSRIAAETAETMAKPVRAVIDASLSPKG